MELNDPRLKLTKKRIESMEALGIHTGEQLLSYYPFRYEVLNALPKDQWKEKDKVTFEGTVVSPVTTFRYGGNKTVCRFDVTSEEEVLHITIFNRPWARQLREDQVLTISGIYNGANRITALTYNTKPISQQETVTPVYTTKASISQKTIRACIRNAWEALKDSITDIMPVRFQRAYRLLPKKTAVQMVHFPANMDQVKAAYRTLKYEEFLRFFTAVEIMKNENGSDAYKTPRLFDHAKLDSLIDSLPFEMTADQKKALDDILKDMESTHMMYRLVQGDVGCGKTLVAALALYACVLAGYQGALLAPTEILARQHYSTICDLLKDRDVRAAVLYSGEKSGEKQQILDDLSNGKIDILIGTHSILEDNVVFQKPGLVVADEQQRFGVEQRSALRKKGESVDFLLMSATPIPRTLASTLYGDMDVSTIETMPPGRKPVITKLIRENSFRSVLDDVMKLLSDGHQLYVICAAVDENEDFDARSVDVMQQNLKKLFEPHGYKVGMLHGRMSSEEKDEVMQKFADNAIQVLVSTTVVEVGMNVVNATGMIVYNAERFGLSQLHQLRGRVQRGSQQGQCWLLTDAKDPQVIERLNVLVKSSNGFEISWEDLRLRGPGDILGTRQSGVPDFVLGNITEDTNMINQARMDAHTIVSDQDNPDYRLLLDAAHSSRSSYGD